MQVRIEDCDDAAFASIAPRLREADAAEWRLFAGVDVNDLGASGYKLPVGAGTLTRMAHTYEGVPLCVWGVSPAHLFPSTPGWVWLVATPEALPVAKMLHLRYLMPEFQTILDMYPQGLVTATWNMNTVHHRWLKWLGFTPWLNNWLMPSGAIFIPHSHHKA